MDTNQPLYDYVMAQLATRRYAREAVAAATGVPYSTVNKIAQRRIKDPSVHAVQKLADFFRAKEASPVQADKEAASSSGVDRRKTEGRRDSDPLPGAVVIHGIDRKAAA